MTHNVLRTILLAAGAAYATLTIGFIQGMPWALALWPWPDTPLSYRFVGAITAALAVGALYAGFTGALRAVAGSLAGLVLIYGAAAALFLRLAQGPAALPTLPHAAVAALTAAAALILLVAVRRQPAAAPDTALPRLVVVSCVGFAVGLAGAGTALVAAAPWVFPWPLSPQSSILFGIIFLGLATIYAEAAWSGARGAGIVTMAGFLLYDLVLLPPFLTRFTTVAPERLLSLTLYTAVLIYSAAVAIWFLVPLALHRT